MNEPIFERISRDASHWFHPDQQPTTTTASQQEAAHMNLTALTADIRTLTEDSETGLRTILDQHIPALTQLAALADQLHNDPLIQAAAVLPPSARQLVTDFIARLAAEFPQPAAGVTALHPVTDPPAPAAPAPAQ